MKKHEINEDMKWKVIIPIHKSIKDILSDDPKHSNIRRKKIYLLKFVFAFFQHIGNYVGRRDQKQWRVTPKAELENCSISLLSVKKGATKKKE